MRKLKQLSPKDGFFIGGEAKGVYQHTAGLILMESVDGSDISFVAFKKRLSKRLKDIPQFRWKLHQTLFGIDLPYWVEDKSFSFDNHIKQIALPSPGDSKALAELASYLYSRHLDRNHPLWETWFIEGLGKGKFAMLQKLHHCMIDGEGATQLAAVLMDLQPKARASRLPPELTQATPGEVPEVWRQTLIATGHLYQMPFKAGKLAFDVLNNKLRQRKPQEVTKAPKEAAPVTSINGYVNNLRGFVYGDLSLAAIKTLKDHYKVTVNDVILALLGTSMRHYLLEQGELPQASLRAFMAVSLRSKKDAEFSNRVSGTNVTLATDIPDPVKRLKAIAGETEQAKIRVHHDGKGFLEMLELLPPIAVNLMMQLTPPQLVPGMTGANMMVSTVRGSPQTMYIAGARMTGMYPLSIISHGTGINVTCISYVDKVNIGVALDPDLFPNAWVFMQGLQKALDEYLALIKPGAAKPLTQAGNQSGSSAGRDSQQSSQAAEPDIHTRDADSQKRTGVTRLKPQTKGTASQALVSKEH